MNYESNKAGFWRNSDFWTFSEVQFLLNGQWPDRGREPPSSLTVHLLEILSETTHDMGDGNFLCEPITECLVVNPVPDHVQLPQMIEDAVTAGKLTAVEGRKKAWHKFDLEDRFRPAEVIAWAISRDCFPDFPFGKTNTDSGTSVNSVQIAPPTPVEESPGNAEGWTVIRPERFGGYRAPLYRFLQSAHREGKSLPTAHDVVEAWRTKPPPEIAQVLADSIDYYEAQGGIKTANTAAIRKSIKRMTNGH